MAVGGRDRRGSEVTDTEVPQQRFDEMRAEQVAGFYHNATPGTIGGMIAAVILASMLVYTKATALHTAVIFLSLLSLSTAARMVLIHAYRKARPPAWDWRRWSFGAIASALAGGLCWGAGRCSCLTQAGRNFSSSFS